MSLPYTQNFDSTTMGALPSGWNATGSGWVTTTSDSTSPPNSASITTSSTTKAYLTYGTPDGNGGDVTIQCSVKDFGAVRPGKVGLTARGSAAALGASTSQYELQLDWNTGHVVLSRVNSGSATSLAEVDIVGGWNQWDTLTWTLSGSAHTVSLQRSSDGEWLTVGGSWQSAQTSAISYTDSSPLTGSGYFGLFSVAGASATHQAWWDDFSATVPGSGGGQSGSIAATEGHDTASLAGHFASSATLAKAESHDTPSIHGVSSVGHVAATEHHDTAAFLSAGVRGSIAATERHDTLAVVGATPNAILTRLEGPDTPAISAAFNVLGTIAATEGRDTPAFAGLARHGILAATERHDTPAFAGHFGASGTIAAAEHHDIPAFVGQATHAVLAAIEAGDRAAIPAVAAGVPPYFKVKEQPDFPQFLGGLPTVRYHVYASPTSGAPIDYTTVVATVDDTSFVPPAVAAPGTWSWGVRAFNLAGEEQNIDAVVTVVFDANGADVSDRPAPPAGLRAFPTGATTLAATTSDVLLESGDRLLLESGNALATEAPASSTASALARVEWYYPPVAGSKSPTQFNVYIGVGTTPDYTQPVAQVPYGQGLVNAYVSDLTGLIGGTTYAVAVRAMNASGEGISTPVVTFAASGAGPLAVMGLTAVATT